MQDINNHCSKELYVIKKQAEFLEIQTKLKPMPADMTNQKTEYWG